MDFHLIEQVQLGLRLWTFRLIKMKKTRTRQRNIDRILGKNLATIRQDRLWTQAKVGRLLRVSQPTIVAIEKGEGGLKAHHLFKILMHFNVPFHRLYPRAKKFKYRSKCWVCGRLEL